MKLKIQLVILFISTLFLNCSTSDLTYYPNISVNYSLSLQDSKYSTLTGFDNAVIIPDIGISGIVVCNNSGSFVAFDCCSPVNVNEKNALSFDNSTSPTCLVDVKSGAKFSFRDGTCSQSPTSGASTRSLKSYTCSKENDITIRITSY